ncbi:PucR family transcriptional regulator [Streptomyces thinghirensis]|uniref:Helix-turn-helix domain-containing protein n=1 Tax=Streptomyces thinghirensis TaxID=551547 RepID=A0ABP9T743_9ACTN
MLLSDLMCAVGEGLLQRRGSDVVNPDLSEVLLDDGATSIGPEQIVLATRPGAEQRLVERAAEAGCRAVVVPSTVQVDAADSVAVLMSDVAWTQLFVLIRTMLLASHDEASTDTGPGSVHGLADAVAVMVGGSVVLYDRAHRVIAYSVQGHEIDHVRRDAILGRRTPDQWIRRFTIDHTAYQTYSEPGRVVRVAEYSDLRTRLRVAVHAGHDVIGEISVAEGAKPFSPHAEEALQRAARLAVPVMLRHRHAQEVEQMSRERTVRALLDDGVLPTQHEGSFPAGGFFVIGFDLKRDPEGPGTLPDHLVAERFVHFLSLHLADIDTASLVARLDDAYWALIPAANTSTERIVTSADRALSQLAGMGVNANAAIGAAEAEERAPATRHIVEDLLGVAASSQTTGRVLTPESSWAELVLVAAGRGLAQSDSTPHGPLQVLSAHDAQHGTEFVATLAIFLHEFGSVSAASARLYLHPNTLRHRMQRIAEVSGLDLDDADQRLAASLLVRGVWDQTVRRERTRACQRPAGT